MRPVFLNEIIGSVNGSNEPQYRIVHDGGTITGAKLTLQNAVTQPGTPVNSATATNLFDFDNLESMKGNRRMTIVNADGSITETITDTALGTVNAARVTTFQPDGTIVEVVTVYSDDGATVMRKTTKTTIFNANGSISEAIT